MIDTVTVDDRANLVAAELNAYHAQRGVTPWFFDSKLADGVGGIRKVDRRWNPLHGGECGDPLAITIDPFPFLAEPRNRDMVVAVEHPLPRQMEVTRFITSFGRVARSPLRNSSGSNYPVLLHDWTPVAFKIGNVLYTPPENALQLLAQMAFPNGAREVVDACDEAAGDQAPTPEPISDAEAHLRRVAAMQIKRYLALPKLLSANEAEQQRLSLDVSRLAEEHVQLLAEFNKLHALFGPYNK